ncbi:MAG: HlyD family efflux transporter periplasmic adaptor subunit [Candidatus Brocadiia bacterium]
MELEKLRIPEEKQSPRTPWALAFFLFFVFGGIGFGLGRFWPSIFPPSGTIVTTAVALPSQGGTVKSFTAGGWIEAAIPQYPIFISSRIPERIESVFVTEGAIVHPGELLVKLYDKDMISRLAALNAKRDSTEKQLKLVKAGFRKEDIDAAAANVEQMTLQIDSMLAKIEQAKEQLRIAQANYERVKDLPDSTISAQEKDNLLSVFRQAETNLNSNVADLNKAKASLRVAQAELAKMQAGSRIEEIEHAEALLKEFDSEIEIAKRNVEYCSLKAPDLGHDLRVLKIYERVGSWIDLKDNSAVLSLYDPEDIQVRVDVTQGNIRKVSVGAEAIVVTDADRTRSYRAKVLRIEPQAELAKNTITVKVKIEKPDLLLFPEMTAQITFMAPDAKPDEKTSGVSIPEASVRKNADGQFVLIVEDGKAVAKRITVVGKIGDSAVIVEGIPSGARVIVTSPEGLKEGEPVTEQQ